MSQYEILLATGTYQESMDLAQQPAQGGMVQPNLAAAGTALARKMAMEGLSGQTATQRQCCQTQMKQLRAGTKKATSLLL